MKPHTSWLKMNDSAKLIKKFAGRKGGRRRVKKGFATNPNLASAAGKKGMAKRWHNKSVDIKTLLTEKVSP